MIRDCEARYEECKWKTVVEIYLRWSGWFKLKYGELSEVALNSYCAQAAGLWKLVGVDCAPEVVSGEVWEGSVGRVINGLKLEG